MSTPTWNPIDRLTAIILVLALIALALLAAPVTAPLLAGLLAAQALLTGRLQRNTSVPLGLLWAALGGVLVLAAALWAWPQLLVHSVRADALLASVDLGWLDWVLGQGAAVSLSLLAWLLLFPAGFMLAWLRHRALPDWLHRHQPSQLWLYQHWTEQLQTILTLLLIQLAGRLALYSLVFWLIGSDIWWLLAMLFSITALLPTLPLLVALALVWLLGPSLWGYGLLALVAVVEAVFWGLARRGPFPGRTRAPSSLLVGLVMLVGAAAAGAIGAVLALALLACFGDTAAPRLAEPVPTDVDDPAPEAIDESMRQEDS